MSESMPRAKNPFDGDATLPITSTPAAAAAPAAGAALDDSSPVASTPGGGGDIDVEAIKGHTLAILKHTFDPEIPVNIYDLGLIYGIEVSPAGVVDVRMTLTSPMCPVAGTLPPEIQQKLVGISGVTTANVEVVWDPPWDKDMMTEAAKLQLGMM